MPELGQTVRDGRRSGGAQLRDLFPQYSGEKVDLNVLGEPPTTMETIGALAPMVGAMVMAPTLPAALLSVPAYLAIENGALPEPYATVAQLLLGIGGKGAAGENLAAPQWRPGMKLRDIEGVSVPKKVAAERGLRNPNELLVEDVARYVQQMVRRHMGEVDEAAAPKVKLRRLMRLGGKEMEDQLSQPETGVGWYDKDLRRADADMAQAFPELSTDAPKNVLLKAISSVLSPAQTPQEEVFNALRAYEAYRQSGRIPLTQPGGARSGRGAGDKWPSYGAEDALAKLQRMLDVMGEQGLADYLTSQHTVADLRRFRPAAEGKASDLRYGAVALGPKVGRYFLGKVGVRGGGTAVDVWDARNKYRQLGNMFDAQGNVVEGPLRESDRTTFMDAHSRLGNEFGLTPEQTQSAQWHYEQALYRALGIPVKTYKLSDGTGKFLRLRGLLPPQR